MALLFRGETNSSTNSKLSLYTYSSNVVTDAEAVRFRIFDLSSDANRQLFYNPGSTELDLQTIQHFPATAGEYKDLDTSNLADADTNPGHKLGVGHYYAEWQVPESATPGAYAIIWEYRFVGDIAGIYKKTNLEFVVAQANFFIPSENIADDVRSYMRDYAFCNELVDGFESTDAQIAKAIELTMCMYNIMAPISVQYTVDNFPVCNKYLVIMGTVGHLLRSISIKQLRNQLTYTDGGVHVGLSDKHQLYKAMGNELLAEFKSLAKDDKISRNLDAAWGTVHSPYHGYYTFYGV